MVGFLLKILNSVKPFFKRRMNIWLKKRIPASQHHKLTSRNIFIFPTKFGFAYLGFVILVFLLGTNYQNNLILLLSYLLASFFITAMMHSFYNFSQLSLTSQPEQTGFAQQKILFPLIITSKKRHFDLNFTLDNKSSSNSRVKLAQCLPGRTQVDLPYLSKDRGEYSLGRVTIFSEYSFGFFKSWTHLDFGLSALVYPKPIPLLLNEYAVLANEDDNAAESYQNNNRAGNDDFSELKSYVLGESRARTAWKQLARGQGHYSKHYQENQGGLLCLSLLDMPQGGIETQLSYLSFLVNELSQNGQRFSLQLTDEHNSIEHGSGLIHQQACLKALALYDV